MAPMSGMTYSRTSGYEILPGTWDYVRGRADIAETDKIEPADRYDFDTATNEQLTEFRRLAEDVNPHLCDSDLEEPVNGIPLKKLIKETSFGRSE